jgi:hypothetical protein
MGCFKAKPLLKEAVQFGGFDERMNPLFEAFDTRTPRWLAKAFAAGRLFERAGVLFVRTLEGTMKAKHGTYIVRGIRGEIYPCEESIFEASYELAHPPV